MWKLGHKTDYMTVCSCLYPKVRLGVAFLFYDFILPLIKDITVIKASSSSTLKDVFVCVVVWCGQLCKTYYILAIESWS